MTEKITSTLDTPLSVNPLTSEEEANEIKETNSETPTAEPSHRSSVKQGEVHPSQKATTPRKRTSRAKPTTKRGEVHLPNLQRGKPAKAVKGKAKETKGKTNGKAKETKAKSKATKPAKEKVTKSSKPKADQAPKTELKIGQIDMRHQLVLYTMRRIDREMTYDQLGSETGLSRAVLRRVINAQIGDDSLVSRGLIVVNEYETEDGEFLPYYFKITTAGKKLVS